MLKPDRLGSTLNRERCRAGVLHRGAGIQDFIYAHTAGQSACYRDDQIRQTQQAQKDLAHIVDQRDNLTLSQRTGIDLHAAAQQQRYHGEVDHQIGQWIHQGGDAARCKLQRFQMIVRLDKGSQFIGLPGKGAHHTGTHIVFTGQQRHTVKAVLCLMVNRHRDPHDCPDDQRDRNGNAEEKQRQSGADRKCHDKRANNNERRSQQQTQGQVHTVLDLIDVTGHPRDQRGGADTVQLAVAQRVNMTVQVPAQRRAKAQCRRGGKVLGRQAAGETDGSQQNQQAAPRPDKSCIPVFDACINDAGDNQRHKQLKTGLQHLEQRRQQGLSLIALDVAHQFVHEKPPLMCRLRVTALLYH